MLPNRLLVALVLVALSLALWVVFFLDIEPAEGAYRYIFTDESGQIRCLGMLARAEMWPSTYGRGERKAYEHGGMQLYLAMLTPDLEDVTHDWLACHVYPDAAGEWPTWTADDRLTLSWDGRTAAACRVLATDSPAQTTVYDVTQGAVLKDVRYALTLEGTARVLMFGFPRGSLRATEGTTWASFELPKRCEMRRGETDEVVHEGDVRDVGWASLRDAYRQ